MRIRLTADGQAERIGAQFDDARGEQARDDGIGCSVAEELSSRKNSHASLLLVSRTWGPYRLTLRMPWRPTPTCRRRIRTATRRRAASCLRMARRCADVSSVVFRAVPDEGGRRW